MPTCAGTHGAPTPERLGRRDGYPSSFGCCQGDGANGEGRTRTGTAQGPGIARPPHYAPSHSGARIESAFLESSAQRADRRAAGDVLAAHEVADLTRVAFGGRSAGLWRISAEQVGKTVKLAIHGLSAKAGLVHVVGRIEGHRACRFRAAACAVDARLATGAADCAAGIFFGRALAFAVAAALVRQAAGLAAPLLAAFALLLFFPSGLCAEWRHQHQQRGKHAPSGPLGCERSVCSTEQSVEPLVVHGATPGRLTRERGFRSVHPIQSLSMAGACRSTGDPSRCRRW